MNLVSIVMPCYNSEYTISRAIDSVLSQSYVYWELIIINDCSSDKSVSIIKEYTEKDKRIKLLENDVNLGVSHSRNIGIKLASGDYLTFLDSDDYWEINKLDLQVLFLLNNNKHICYTYYTTVNENEFIIKNIKRLPSEVNYNKLLKGNPIGMSTSMLDMRVVGKNYFEKVGHEDYLFWLSILKKGFNAYCLKEFLVYYTVSRNSLSGNKIKAIGFTWKIYRESLRFSFIKSLYYFSVHILSVFYKKKL